MSISKRFQNALDREPQDDPSGRPAGVLCVDPNEGECLWVFNDEGFDREMSRFDTPALAGEDDRGDQRDFFEYVTDFTLDTSGRLVIPERFRKLVGIGDVAVATGMNSRLEIWPEGAWERRKRGKHSPMTDRAGTIRAADDHTTDQEEA